MGTFIDQYFKDPASVAEDIFVRSFSKRVTAEEFYNLEEPEQDKTFVLMKRIECKDGFSMSVQANYSAYCLPRVTIRSKHTSFYDKFEVGFPSEIEELLMPYAEQPGCPTETIYAYVPKEVINRVIAKHNSL